jgi:hypothetical protein
MLEAWVAEAQRIAKRRRRGAMERVPDPPAGLIPDDCAAAGFKRYGHYFVRKLTGIKVRVNFSPDLEHQAVFLEVSKGRHRALLWIDGRPAPVPVDTDGNPKSKELAHWLDHRFSTGFVTMDVEDPAVPVALWAWRSEVGRLALQGSHSFAQEYPVPPEGSTAGAWRANGSTFTGERQAYNYLDSDAKGTVYVEFSPDFQHQAVLVKGPRWPGALLWVNGEPVPVPHDKEFGPMCDSSSATWLDNRFVYAQIGGLWDHPLLDPTKISLLGQIRGLLIWDTAKRVQHLELPEPTQAWTSPILHVGGHSWCIYADAGAVADNRPDRVLPIPT